MNTQSIIEAIFMTLVIVGSILYWFTLIGDLIEDNNKQARARKNKQHNNKPARLTYGDESHDEVERMYREAGLIK